MPLDNDTHISLSRDELRSLRSLVEEFARDKADQGMCADPYTLGRINRAREVLARVSRPL